MNMLEAIILGVVQGIAEFLPISSSGHLVLFQKLFGIDEPGMLFDVILHIGTLIPIMVVYWSDIWELIKKPFQKYVYMLIIATLPAVFVGLFFEDYIDALFATGQLLGFGFLFTGIMLMYADKKTTGQKTEEDMTYADALFIGCMQGIAVMPAVSRSGSTISGALFRNINRESAAKFSFLMSIPVIGGALLLQILDIAKGDVVLEQINYLNYFVGFVASTVSGYFAIRFMLDVIKKAKLKYFSYYVFVLAGFIFADQLFFHLFF